MAENVALGFDPIWYISDLIGRPAAGCSLYSRKSINKSVPLAIYQSPDGTNPYTNPIVFGENGTRGTPFYFLIDDTQDTLYYLFVNDENGNLIWDVDNYRPSGSGGGGTVNVTYNIDNLLVNGSFFRHITAVPDNKFNNPANFLKVAPSIHAGITTGFSDIIFTRSTSGAISDYIQFLDFPANTDEFSPDQTPVSYLRYHSDNNIGESYKAILYPVTKGLGTYTGTEFTFTAYARAVGEANSIIMAWYSYTGTGGTPTPSFFTNIGEFFLDADEWTPISDTSTPPPVPVSVGNNQDDVLYLAVLYPINEACTIDHTKMSLYAGEVAPEISVQTYDEIESIVDGFRTGDTRTSMNEFTPYGWVRLNDSTIGKPGSGATYAAYDSFPLYELIWNQTSDNPDFAPVSTGRGVSAAADFNAGKTLQPLYGQGAVLGNIGTPSSTGYGPNQYPQPWKLGEPYGEGLHPLVVAELAAHHHTYSQTFSPGTGGFLGSGIVGSVRDANTSNTGSGTGHNTIQPTLSMNIFIKL